MPQSSCFGAIQCVGQRFASLTATGAPNVGANRGYTSNILTEATITPEVEEGLSETVKTAAGNICQTFEECDRLKSVTIEINVCSLEPDLCGLLAGGRTFTQNSKTLGWEFPNPTDACQNGTSCELWQLAWDQDQQATSNIFAGTTLTYVHWIFPRVLWQVSDFTISSSFTIFKFTGKAKVNDRITANGPFDDWETGLANAGGMTGLGGFIYDDAVPTASCGLITVPGVAS